MKIGKVIGPLPLARSADCMHSAAFLRIQTDCGEIAAADLTGAAPGDQVLLLEGKAARCSCMDTPVDAAVVGVLE